MKRILSVLSLLALAAVALALPAHAQAGAQRVGFVNSARLLAETPALNTARQQLQQELGRYQTEVDSLERLLQTANDELQRQASTLSEQARTQRQTELQQRFQTYQTRVNEIQQLAARREQEVVAPIIRQINDAVEAARREGQFAYIIDLSEGQIVAVDPALDLTQRVLQRLGAPAAPANP